MDGRDTSDGVLKEFWWEIPVFARWLLTFAVLAVVAILVIDPAPAHHLREELFSWFLTGIFAIGLAFGLLAVVTCGLGAFVAIWGRGYEKTEKKVREHRGVAIPTFLSVFSALTVTQATQAIGTLTSAQSILLAAATACFTGVGTMLQERADKYGDQTSWTWARRIGMVLVILPPISLVVVGWADDWPTYFLDASGIDQACLVLTVVIESVTVVAGFALNKAPKAQTQDG